MSPPVEGFTSAGDAEAMVPDDEGMDQARLKEQAEIDNEATMHKI